MGLLLRTLRTMMYKLSFTAIGFVSGALVAHFVTVSDRGIYNVITTSLLLGSTFMSGYSNFFNYGMNRLKYDRADVMGVLARLYIFLTILTVTLLAISLALIPFNPIFQYIAFIFATLPFVVFSGYCGRLVQALNEIDWLNRLNSIQAVLFMVFAIVLFSYYHFDHRTLDPRYLSYTLWAWLVTNAIAAALSGIITSRLTQTRFTPKANPEIRRKMLNYGHNISLQNLLAQLNYRGDLYSVIILAGPKAAGWYGIAVSSSEILWQVSSSIALMVYTRVAREQREHSIALTERTFRLTFWLLVVGALVMLFGFSPLIHIVYGQRYANSVAPFKVLLLGTMAFGTTGVFTQFFTDQLGKVKYPMYMQAVSLATNLLLCLVLIPHIGMMGGAIASSIAYGVALIMSIFYFRHHTGRPIRQLFLLNAGDLSVLNRLTSVARGVQKGSK